jgi:hypothetical protein
MKRLLTGLITALALTLGALTLPTPASAHNYDNTSLWVCAATRPNASYSIDHSWPYYVVPSHVGERCMAHSGSTLHACWDADYNTTTGQITGPLGHYYDPCPWDPHEI